MILASYIVLSSVNDEEDELSKLAKNPLINHELHEWKWMTEILKRSRHIL